MPKLIDYPRGSHSRSIALAEAVDYLGGSAAIQSVAERMGSKVSGAFAALIGAARKHGLVDTNKGKITTTDLFRRIKLAYNEEEKLQNIRKSFLYPPVYTKVYEQFLGKELPTTMLDKLLIREFGVEDEIAPRVATYFIEGARAAQILVDGKIVDEENKGDADLSTTEEIEITPVQVVNDAPSAVQTNRTPATVDVFSTPVEIDAYVIQIVGPGLNYKLTINDEDDFIILDATLNKIRKKLKN